MRARQFDGTILILPQNRPDPVKTITYSRKKITPLKLVSIVYLAMVFQFFSSTTSAEIPRIDQLRSRVQPGPYQPVQISPQCKIYSFFPQDKDAYFNEWTGKCINGFAEGYGVHKKYTSGLLSQISLGTFTVGRWTQTEDSYAITLGRIVQYRRDSIGMYPQFEVQPETLPSWAQPLLQYLPMAKKEWDEEVQRRKEEQQKIFTYTHSEEVQPDNEDLEIDPSDVDEKGRFKLFSNAPQD